MISAILLALLSQLCVGSAILACTPGRALDGASRFTRLAIVLFSGVASTTLAVLWLLCLGAPWDPGWLYAFGALGAVVTILRMRAFRVHWLVSPCVPCSSGWAALPLTVGFAALAAWMLVSALCLPSVDYDSIAIWSYRVRVLLREGSLYSDSLRDPLRVAPMPKHPYFLPVLEALYCGRAGFSQLATHIPHLVLFGTGAAVVLGACYEWLKGPVRLAVLAALLCMPAPAVQWWLEGAREPAIGVAAVWSTYWIARWLASPARLASVMLALGFAAMYHMKVEGTVLAAASIAALFLAAALMPDASRARLASAGTVLTFVAIAALPWMLAKASIAPTNQDYDFTEGFAAGWGRRLHLVPFVVWMTFSEIFLRPELYGIAPHAAVVWLVLGIRRRTWRESLILLLPLLTCLAGIVAIYVVRQEQFGPARNVTFSRRFVCVVPAIVLASAWLWSRARIGAAHAAAPLKAPEAS
jgi:hypothetical protein